MLIVRAEAPREADAIVAEYDDLPGPIADSKPEPHSSLITSAKAIWLLIAVIAFAVSAAYCLIAVLR